MAQEQKQPRRSQEEEEPDEAPAPDGAATERKEQLDDDIDAILGDIDDVLETNAEDFVKSFIQKGGQ
ncbi:MAG: ubiquitin-like protein Pup [Marmoricola sp.]